MLRITDLDLDLGAYLSSDLSPPDCSNVGSKLAKPQTYLSLIFFFIEYKIKRLKRESLHLPLFKSFFRFDDNFMYKPMLRIRI